MSLAEMTVENRRDSFCGKMSTCNNLHQYGIKYSLTSRHTMDPTGADFRADLHRFVATCRTVAGLKGARVGVIGARPAAFNTVRFSEKLLERTGISVETVDLSEMFGKALKLNAQDAEGPCHDGQDSRRTCRRATPRRKPSSRWPGWAW